MKRKITLRIDKNKLQVVTLCVLLCATTFLPTLEARKSKKSKKSSATYTVNPGSLSYNDYQQKPKPSAPGAAKPPPYPVQQQPGHTAPPPPYPQHGAPPPYSSMNNPNGHPPPFNQGFNPGNQGFRPGQPGGFGPPGHTGGFGPPGHSGSFGQPGGFGPPGHTGGFGQPGHTGGFGQPGGQLGGHGHQPSFGGFPSSGTGYHAPLPHGGLQSGGVAPTVNYAPAPSFPIAAIPVGAYKPQSSGIGAAAAAAAAGAGTGLLAGAAGSAIFNALKPEERVPDGTPFANATVVPVASNATHHQLTTWDVKAGGVFGTSNTTIIMNNNSTSVHTNNSTQMSTPIPLAQANNTTPAVPTGKQYYPPPGQYFPATGQYVPPGEYDSATGVFTPGRYISNTSIFQQGQYDPLTQIFTPGSYDPATGKFVVNPNNGPVNLGATHNATVAHNVTVAHNATVTGHATGQMVANMTDLP